MHMSYIDEAYGDNPEVVFSLKQLKSKSITYPASNLEDRETLIGCDTTDVHISRPATIIYTSGSTGKSKGIYYFKI